VVEPDRVRFRPALPWRPRGSDSAPPLRAIIASRRLVCGVPVPGARRVVCGLSRRTGIGGLAL